MNHDDNQGSITHTDLNQTTNFQACLQSVDLQEQSKMTAIKKKKKCDKCCLTSYYIRTLVMVCLGSSLASLVYRGYSVASSDYLSPQDIEQVTVGAESLSLAEPLPDSNSIIDPLFKDPFVYYDSKSTQLPPESSQLLRESPQLPSPPDRGASRFPTDKRLHKRIDRFKESPRGRGRPGMRGPTTPLDLNFLKRTPIEPSMSAFGSSENDATSSILRSDNTNSSIFDCESELRQCRYFYPSHFFIDTLNSTTANNATSLSADSQYGKGKEFYPTLIEMETLLQQRKLWLQMPYVGLWTMSFNNDKINPLTNHPFSQQNVTFLHVHKTGGTTIVKHANSKIQSMTGRATQHFKVYMFQWMQNDQDRLNIRGSKLMLRGGGMFEQHDSGATFQKTLDHLKYATKYKHSNNWNERDHLLFGVVRDPTDRFISMIGQAFGANGSARNGGVAEELKRDCINSNEYTLDASRFTIQCVIDKIKEYGYFFEIHFTPQAIEVAFSTQMMPNLPVALFPFSKLKQVLTEIGCSPNTKVRDGGGRYRPAPVLQSMTVDDYTPNLIKQICKLYKVDVIMLRALGWSVPRCDPYIST